jgi:NitT/TauT family transport system permease protein
LPEWLWIPNIFRGEDTRPLRLISILLFLLIWQGASLLANIPQLFPTPVAVVVALGQLLIAPGPPGMAWAGELLGNTLISLWRVIVGFSLAAVTGVLLGIIIGWWRNARDLVEPVIEILRPIPPLAWIPLAMLWFGLGFKPAVFLIWLGAFFPILLNTVLGMENTPHKLIEVSRTLGAGPWQILFKVGVPSAAPSIMAGLRIGIGIGWMCLVAAELTGSNSGLGYMIMYYYSTMEASKTVAGMLMIGIVGYLMFTGLKKFEDKILFWKAA